jgi:hypothetical protein
MRIRKQALTLGFFGDFQSCDTTQMCPQWWVFIAMVRIAIRSIFKTMGKQTKRSIDIRFNFLAIRYLESSCDFYLYYYFYLV